MHFAKIGAAFICVVAAACATGKGEKQAVDTQEPFGVPRGTLVVTDFGAKGDGVTDDTGAFQQALDAAGDAGAGVVHVPAGRYLIKTHLNVPPAVTLEGIWRAPVRGLAEEKGSVLLAVEGKGSLDGAPFIKLNTSSTLKGLTIFYPEQIKSEEPHPYPWTVQGEGDNCTVLDVTMINPYQAVDFGTKFCGRHYIRGLYAQALFKGLFIDQCYDVGRVEDVHFWPFWEPDYEAPTVKFLRKHGTAFIFARTDGQMATNCFQIFYNVGFHFVDAGHGPGSGAYTNCYSDVSPCAVKVDATQEHAGVSFVNGMFMSSVEVAPTNKGPVKFNGSGFWSIRDLGTHARLQGKGAVLFQGCHFHHWDRVKEGWPAIDANNEALVVSGCDFLSPKEGQLKVRLGANLKSAVVMGNRMEGGVKIENNAPAGADVQIGLNTGR